MTEHWYLFPVGVAVASAGMSSGISGSNFWIPIYLLFLELEPRLAFWVSLLTMLFGFGSGVARNAQAGTLDLAVAQSLALVLVPATLLGAGASTVLDGRWAILGFAVFAFGYAVALALEARRGGRARLETPAGAGQVGAAQAHPWRGRVVRVALGGALQGLIATGSGTLMLGALLAHPRVRDQATAIGTTVLLVFVASLLAVVGRIDGAMVAVLRDRWPEIAGILAFAGPGVVLGGQLGPRLARPIGRRTLRAYVAALLLGVSGLMAYRAAVAFGVA
ncbi:MAG: sulfite exporter TauE/SafE family protein [Sandaracinaceae bacterium]